MADPNSKLMIVYAGPSGSGKSTRYRADRQSDPYLASLPMCSPDEFIEQVAREHGYDQAISVPPEQMSSILIEAIRLFRQKRDELFAAGKSFVYESSACSRRIIRILDQAYKLGYFVDIRYYVLMSGELTLERIKERVNQGGLGMPPEDLLRNYKRAMALLPKVLARSDKARVYDNSGAEPVNLILSNGRGRSISFGPSATFTRGEMRKYVSKMLFERALLYPES